MKKRAIFQKKQYNLNVSPSAECLAIDCESVMEVLSQPEIDEDKDITTDQYNDPVFKFWFPYYTVYLGVKSYHLEKICQHLQSIWQSTEISQS